jgi:S1-C subfamily serine protease
MTRGCSPRAFPDSLRLAAAVWVTLGALSPSLSSAANGDQPATFEPGEISIGEPIALPFSSDPGAAAVPPARAEASSPVTAGGQSRGTPGSGWLGLSVAESNVPGRWRIDEVAAGGPAAKAGLVPGDELRAIEGVPLEAADDVSAVLATIAAGQDVRVAVARADTVGDLVLRAEPRPTVQVPPAQAAAERSSDTPRQPAPRVVSEPSPNAIVDPTMPGQLTQPQVVQPPVAEAVGVQARAPQPAVPQPAVPQPAVPQPAVPQPAVPAWQSVGEVRGPQPLPSALPAPLVAPPATRLPAAAAPALAGSQPDWNAIGQPHEEQHGPEGHRGRTALGVRTVPIDPVLQARFSLSEPAGAYVIGVVHDLPASRAGVPPGSVIVALDDRPVRSPTELTQLVSVSPVDRPVAVQFVLPGGEAKRADVMLQSLSAPLEQALTGEPMATAVPTLEPGPVPQRVERASAGDAAAAVRDEIRWLRERLDRLERRLDLPRPTMLR